MGLVSDSAQNQLAPQASPLVVDVPFQPLGGLQPPPGDPPIGDTCTKLFPAPQEQGQVCSMNVCEAGHSWPPELAVTKCPGCAAQIIVAKMVNCPICNEPTAKLVYRMDHLPHGGTVMPMCKGSASLAEVTEVTLERRHAAEEQAQYKDREVINKI